MSSPVFVKYRIWEYGITLSTCYLDILPKTDAEEDLIVTAAVSSSMDSQSVNTHTGTYLHIYNHKQTQKQTHHPFGLCLQQALIQDINGLPVPSVTIQVSCGRTCHKTFCPHGHTSCLILFFSLPFVSSCPFLFISLHFLPCLPVLPSTSSSIICLSLSR